MRQPARNCTVFPVAQSAFTRLAYSPNGKTLAACFGDKTVRLWDVVSGKELHRWDGFPGTVGNTAAFSPDGKMLAVPWKDKKDQTIRLWDTESGKEVRRVKVPHFTHLGVAFATGWKDTGLGWRRPWRTKLGPPLGSCRGQRAASAWTFVGGCEKRRFFCERQNAFDRWRRQGTRCTSGRRPRAKRCGSSRGLMIPTVSLCRHPHTYSPRQRKSSSSGMWLLVRKSLSADGSRNWSWLWHFLPMAEFLRSQRTEKSNSGIPPRGRSDTPWEMATLPFTQSPSAATARRCCAARRARWLELQGLGRDNRQTAPQPSGSQPDRDFRFADGCLPGRPHPGGGPAQMGCDGRTSFRREGFALGSKDGQSDPRVAADSPTPSDGYLRSEDERCHQSRIFSGWPTLACAYEGGGIIRLWEAATGQEASISRAIGN